MYQGLQLVCAYFLAPFRILMVRDFWEGFFCHFSQFNPILFDKSSIAKINRLSTVNDVSVGSPSRMRMVLLISLGMTTLPRSSIRLTIPVAFIYNKLLCFHFCGTAVFSVSQRSFIQIGDWFVLEKEIVTVCCDIGSRIYIEKCVNDTVFFIRVEKNAVMC